MPDAPARTEGDAEVDWLTGLRRGAALARGGAHRGRAPAKPTPPPACWLLLAAMEPLDRPWRVALAAPTGKAAARLRQSIDGALQDLQTRRCRVP